MARRIVRTGTRVKRGEDTCHRYKEFVDVLFEASRGNGR
jgi:hypothetical protein